MNDNGVTERDTQKIASRLTINIKSFSEPSIRANYLVEKLSNYSPSEIAEILSYIYQKAKQRRDEGSILSITTLLYEDVFVEKLGLTTIGEIYRQLINREGPEELIDIIGVAYKRWKELKKKNSNYIPSKDEHAEIRELTLGEKKFLARKPDRNMIEKIKTVRDPQVVYNLLNNPRALERDILSLITKRPTNPEVLRLVSQHPRWNMRYTIRKALVFNPYTPIDVALKLLNTLLKQDLKEITRDKTLSPHLRKRARELINNRRKEKD